MRATTMAAGGLREEQPPDLALTSVIVPWVVVAGAACPTYPYCLWGGEEGVSLSLTDANSDVVRHLLLVDENLAAPEKNLSYVVVAVPPHECRARPLEEVAEDTLSAVDPSHRRKPGEAEERHLVVDPHRGARENRPLEGREESETPSNRSCHGAASRRCLRSPHRLRRR